MIARSQSLEKEPKTNQSDEELGLDVQRGEAFVRNRVRQCVKFEHVQDRSTREKLDGKDPTLTAFIDYGNCVHDSRVGSSGILPFHLQVSL